MTRGRRGSLALRRRALSSPPPCRFIPALSVVPLAVEVVPLQDAGAGEGLHVPVGDLDAGGVGGGVQVGADGQTGVGGGRGDRFDDDFVAGQGPAAPVHGDEREQPVLDLVPLAGARGQVADGDGQAGAGGQGGQFGLPLPGAVAVGPAAVGGDQQPGRVGVGGPPCLVPPLADGATANAAVSWSVPTPTQPVFSVT